MKNTHLQLARTNVNYKVKRHQYFVLYLVCIYPCAVVFLCRYRIYGE